MSEFNINYVYGSVNDDIAARVELFWLQHNAVASTAEVEGRMSQVAVIAMKDQEICGVGSIFEVFHDPLGHHFYGFRCFISEDARLQGISIEFVNTVYANLDLSYSSEITGKPIGIIVNVQHKGLNQSQNEAVRPRSGLVFVGYDSLGRQIRVRYFTGARITTRGVGVTRPPIR